MNEPNYESCSSNELHNILSHIDHNAWPDRVSKIKALLESKSQDKESSNVKVLLVDKTNAVDVFSPKQIFLGSYLGEPLAALYYLKSNFKALNNKTAENYVLYIGSIFIILLTVSLLYIPENFPRIAIPLIYSGIALLISEQLQISKEKEATSKDYRFSSSWLVTKIAIISLVSYLVFSFGVLYAVELSRINQVVNNSELESTLKDAKNGDIDAQTRLGVMYALGEGVAVDSKQAVYWYKKAAESGSASAQSNLGYMYKVGTGVPIDNREALNWWNKAAKKGDAQAQYNLGQLYLFGDGVEKSFSLAASWHQMAADQEYTGSEYSLGLMYFRGEGVEQNHQLAFELIGRAAGKNDMDSQAQLGFMYANGYGVSKDIAKAKHWYALAAEKGDNFAIKKLAELEQ